VGPLKLKLAKRIRTAEPGAGAKTRLTKTKAAAFGWHARDFFVGRGEASVGEACSSCRTGGWREDPADEELIEAEPGAGILAVPE
jgi:hypothetical protein